MLKYIALLLLMLAAKLLLMDTIFLSSVLPHFMSLI